MGDVVLFRDRRSQSRLAENHGDPAKMNRAQMHDHLREQHGWGGPRSSTRARMDHVHEISHRTPWGWEKPHRHDPEDT